ncbi:MAG TPA: Na+/H+ antiporter NhaC family protein [Methanocorpusculum sp.]|nr:Na+/H+ antiporter NhaC family protein [Methanocorpusculum sp.]
MEKKKLFNILAIIAVVVAFALPLLFTGAGANLAANNDAGFIEWYNQYMSVGQTEVTDHYSEDIVDDPGTVDKARNGYLLQWATLIAPILTLLLAFLTKNVIISLFLGVLNGAWTAALLTGNVLQAIVDAFYKTTDATTGFVATVADSWNAGIIMAVLVIGCLIALITRMGGMKGVGLAMTKIAKGPRSAQLSVWLSSWLIFFDDYANALIIGPIMRPVCDKFRISREKLAYIVDSTAAPVAGIFIISTWIGTELVNISQGLEAAGITGMTAMDVFVQTIPFRFYNILALFFVLALALFLRDYGPMRKAELRARSTGETVNPGSEVDPEAATMDTNADDDGVGKEDYAVLKTSKKVHPPNVWNALVPILVLIVSAVVLFYTNGASALGEVWPSAGDAFGAADASIVLFQAGLLACIVAIIMGFAQKIFTLKEGIEVWAHGMKSMMFVCIILVLAWTIGATIKYLGTQYFLIPAIAGTPVPWLIPMLVFVIAALTSFATGTAYGTMAIYLPICIPLAFSIALVNPEIFADPLAYVVLVSSAVLTGAIFGDHCSPISDTTIMSSTGAGCSLLDHVSTQIWYALTVAFVTIALYIVSGLLLTFLGTGALFPIAFICLGIGAIVCVLVILFVGKKIPTWNIKTQKLEGAAESEKSA